MKTAPVCFLAICVVITLAGCRIGTHTYKTVRVRVLDAEQKPELGVQGALVRVETTELGGIGIRSPKPDQAFTDFNGEASLRVPTGEQEIEWSVFQPGYCGYSEQVSQVKIETPPDSKVFRIWKCPAEIIKKSLEARSQ